MRDALSILERCNQDGEDNIDENKIRDLVGIPQITYVKQIVESIINTDVTMALQVIEDVLKQGKDLNNLLWEIIKYVKDILLFKSTGNAETYNKQEIEDIKNISERVKKEELIDLICNLSELENSVKLSTQKLIIFQAGIIKLCNRKEVGSNATIDKSSVAVSVSNNNSDLEARVTKIENFLKASNFAEKGVKPRFSVSQNKDMQKVQEQNPPKPKYEGKTQDYWPKLVNDFKEEGKMFMYINLAGTVAKEINDMTIAIEFPNGMSEVAKEFLERPENKMNLKKIIAMASGKDMQIKYVDIKPQTETKGISEFETFVNNQDVPFNII